MQSLRSKFVFHDLLLERRYSTANSPKSSRHCSTEENEIVRLGFRNQIRVLVATIRTVAGR
jgi:hypothetical protein